MGRPGGLLVLSEMSSVGLVSRQRLGVGWAWIPGGPAWYECTNYGTADGLGELRHRTRGTVGPQVVWAADGCSTAPTPCIYYLHQSRCLHQAGIETTGTANLSPLTHVYSTGCSITYGKYQFNSQENYPARNYYPSHSLASPGLRIPFRRALSHTYRLSLPRSTQNGWPSSHRRIWRHLQ